MNRYEIETTRNRTTRTVTAKGKDDYDALRNVTDSMYADPEDPCNGPYLCHYIESEEAWVYATANATHIVRRFHDAVIGG